MYTFYNKRHPKCILKVKVNIFTDEPKIRKSFCSMSVSLILTLKAHNFHPERKQCLLESEMIASHWTNFNLWSLSKKSFTETLGGREKSEKNKSKAINFCLHKHAYNLYVYDTYRENMYDRAFLSLSIQHTYLVKYLKQSILYGKLL